MGAWLLDDSKMNERDRIDTIIQLIQIDTRIDTNIKYYYIQFYRYAYYKSHKERTEHHRKQGKQSRLPYRDQVSFRVNLSSLGLD